VDKGMVQSALLQSVRSGFFKGLHGYVWIMKILVPISFFTALLVWTGALEKTQFLIAPVMGWLDLPPAAALPLLIGTLANIYAGIAAMMVLPLTTEQMTLIAVFLLIAHSLIQEGAVQGATGLNPFKAALLRLTAACAAVKLTALFVNPGAPAGPGEPTPALSSAVPFGEMVSAWLGKTVSMGLVILLIILFIMMLIEIAKTFGWIDSIVRFCRPALKVLGLSEKGGVIWMTSAVFGLLYGAAVIVEEVQGGGFEKTELEGLQISIGINHSMIEDPMLFMALGLSAFWLWVPRLVMAVLVVQLFRLWHHFHAGRRTMAAAGR